MLLDASAAPYADVDEIRIVGLIEADWPERSARSIFYPQSLLAQLGWPGEQDRLPAARARFQDLLRLPRRRVSLSTFTLEDDAIVSPSPLLEDVDAAGLPIERLVRAPGVGVGIARVRARGAARSIRSRRRSSSGEARASGWRCAPSRRFDEPRFRGTTGPRAPSTYAVSRLERYLECPFKYFAAHVLKLPEERDEQAWMTPQERGHFVHEVFESFFAEWQRLGHGAITTANVAEAHRAVRHRRRARISRSCPKGIARSSARCSSARRPRPGSASARSRSRSRTAMPVVERLLEYQLEGTFTFAAAGGPRQVTLRSKADRIDLLAGRHAAHRGLQDSAARRSGSASLQLPIYGVCAQQALEGRHGRSWTVARAGYIAFKEKTAVQSSCRTPAEGARRRAGDAARRSSTRSSAASSRSSPTSRSSATGARTPACAARTTSATSSR